MKQIKRILSVLLTVVLLVCAVPVGNVGITASAITESEFNSRLSSLRSQFPNYSTWYDYYDGGHQCWGFARLIADSVFGGSWKNWTQVNSISNVKAGDIVQYGNTSGSGHTIFVQSVSGNTITFVDCNGNGNYSGGTKVRSCGIKWDNTIEKGSRMFGKYSFSYLLSSPSFDNPTPANPNEPQIDSCYIDYSLSNRTTFRPNCIVDPDAVAIDHVSLAVWSEGSQSDLRWYDCIQGGPHGTIYYYDVPLSNHDSGAKSFICDFYVYGVNGKSITVRISYNADADAPKIWNISFKHVSGGFTVTCNVSDNTGISSVAFPTWTTNNGQDDLVWHEGSVSGNVASCTIKISDHNNEEGPYITHIYAYDTMGNATQDSTPYIYVGNFALDVNGYLDGTNAGNLGNYGTFDIYFDGIQNRNDVNDYANLISCGTTFEIKDIKAKPGYTYNGVKSGTVKGTMNGSNTVVLNFTTNSSTLKVNPNGGAWNGSTATQSFTQKYNTTKAIPVPTRSGYTFIGWTRGGANGKMSSTTAAATYTYGMTNNVTDTITASWSCNHNYTSVVTTQPTCIAQGVRTYTCSQCGDVYTESISINASNHVNTKTVAAVASTCTVKGYTAGIYCNDCKKYISGHAEQPLAAHTITIINKKDATYDATGYTGDEYCTVCKQAIKSGTVIPKLETPTDPTPTQPDQPQKTGSCKWCGNDHGGAFGWLVKIIHNILAAILGARY